MTLTRFVQSVVITGNMIMDHVKINNYAWDLLVAI